MLCFRASRNGGVSKMASAAAIHEKLREQPEVFPGVSCAGPEVHWAKNMVETITAAYAESGELDRVKRSLAALEAACSDPQVVSRGAGDGEQYWNLQAGEAYLVDNYRWLHARSNFEDDPAAPRLFFRLWLQVENFH
eukprot:Skav234771  [mRNA]  locus=scaffold2396:256190:259654:- [translate_table: standard]